MIDPAHIYFHYSVLGRAVSKKSATETSQGPQIESVKFFQILISHFTNYCCLSPKKRGRERQTPFPGPHSVR